MNNDTSANWSNEKMRVALLDKVSEIYNETHKNKPVKFTEQQKYTFSKLGSFGVPLAKMGEYLDLIDPRRWFGLCAIGTIFVHFIWR